MSEITNGGGSSKDRRTLRRLAAQVAAILPQSSSETPPNPSRRDAKPPKPNKMAEEGKHRGRIWGTLGTVAMALVPWVVPRLPISIAIAMAVIWVVSWPMAHHGYKYNLAYKWAIALMFLHGGILALVAYSVWPRITVSPARLDFRGYPNETFNMSVRNGRAEDVYDVQIPFLIGYNKHFQDKISAKVPHSEDLPQSVTDDYHYCFGEKGDGDVKKVMPNEKEVLIVRIEHLVPFGNASFSVTYTGGEELEIKPGTSTFLEEPYSYSSNQRTVSVRGDYRICKYVIHTDGVGAK